jgi:hypothetical protein
MRSAQQQLGHKSLKTTVIYVRSRVGEKVTPTIRSECSLTSSETGLARD